MKTSIKILLTSLLLIIVSLVVYDSQLRAEYLQGNFRKPFGDFTPANFRNFNSIELRSGTAINIMVTKGPYKVMVDPGAGDFVKLSKQGDKLIVQAVFNDHYRYHGNDYTIFISCPNLESFSSDARYKVNDWTVTDTLPNIFEKKASLISGFNSNKLFITENNGSNILLENNHIDTLRVVAGSSYHSGSIITIGKGNSFDTAYFSIQNKGTLSIEAPAGNHINYHIADSARININGAIYKQQFKTTQP